MLKTYQFKTECKGDIHSSKTANIILPGLVTEYIGEHPYVYKRSRLVFKLGDTSCFNQHPWIMHLNFNTHRAFYA